MDFHDLSLYSATTFHPFKDMEIDHFYDYGQLSFWSVVLSGKWYDTIFGTFNIFISSKSILLKKVICYFKIGVFYQIQWCSLNSKVDMSFQF